MATLAIGDIHGNLRALNDLLEKVIPKLSFDDTVVFLGDIIDGAPDSKGCVDRVIQFADQTKAKIVYLKGNHEEWFFDTMHDHTRHSWLISMKGLTTIASYSPEAEQLIRREMQRIGPPLIVDHLPLPYDEFFKHVPQHHIDFFQKLVTYHRSEDCVCVHGGVSRNYTAVENEDEHMLIWGQNGFPEYYKGADTIVYGHWSKKIDIKHGWPVPWIVGNTIGIDSISHGVLTANWMPDRRIVQSFRHQY